MLALSLLAGAFWLGGLSSVAHGQTPGSLDTGFNPSVSGSFSYVVALAVQSDGKVLIGGAFTSVNGVARNNIARLNADGSLDTGFNPGSGTNSSVSEIALQSDGKVLIGGNFTSVNGVARIRIARLNADGSLDASFDPKSGATYPVNALAVQSDGKVLVGSEVFTGVTINTVRYGIVRLNADGSVDTGFDPVLTTSSIVYALTVQSDGKVLIGGAFTSVNGVARNRIARLNADGSLDASFDPGSGSNGVVRALMLQSDGKVLIGGGFSSFNGVARFRVARLNADGSLDTGLDSGLRTGFSAYAVAVQIDGKVIVGGGFDVGAADNIARLNADGSVDTGFDPGLGINGEVHEVALQSDGKVLVGGVFTSVNGVARSGLARLNGGNATPPLTQPTVAITSPPVNITVAVGQSLPLAASVTDPSGILAQVQFFLNGSLIGSTGNASLFVFDAVAPPAPGTYTLMAAAIDTQGRQSNSEPRTITVLAADAANPTPSATLLTDLNNRNLAAGSTVTLTAAASDLSPGGDGLARVEFYADGVLFASFDAAGNPLTSAYGPAMDQPMRRAAGDPVGNKTVFQAVYQLPGLDKLINLIAVAVDKLGRSQVSSSVTVHSVVTADRAPLVSLGTPSSGKRVRVGAEISVPATVSDPDAPSTGSAARSRPVRRAFDISGVVARVEYFVNKLKVKDSVETPFGFNFTPPAAGTYVLTAIATDGSGLAKVSEPLIIIAASGVNVSVLGNGVAVEGGAKGKVLFSRTDTSGDLTVYYKTKGTAKNGKDYESLSGNVVIPAGEESVKLKIKPKDNAKAKGTLKLTIQLLESPSGDYDMGESTKAKLRMLDND